MTTVINYNFWKWGNPQHTYHLSNFPKFKTFLEKKFNTDLKEDSTAPDNLNLIQPPLKNEKEIGGFFPLLKSDQISAETNNRLRYALGKSYKDIIKAISLKEFPVPDFILFPETTKDIEYIFKSAAENKIKIITFSGGSNVVGAFNGSSSNDSVPRDKYNATCILNMQRMNRLIDLDEISHTATFETGIFGPEVEKILNEKGFTLGHFPQSFEYSTLGGWLAMRSAGQESGLYGKIEDMVLWLKVITPAGTIENIDFPRHACGMDIHQLFLGSEGTLGVIVQAKLRLRKIPGDYLWKIALFKNFENGSGAIREIIQSGIHPAIMRLSDAHETEMLSLISQKEKNKIQKWRETLFKSWLKSKGYVNPCLLMMRFAINKKSDIHYARAALRIAKSKNGKPLPASIAGNWEKSRFSLPYLRDTLIEHRVLTDTFETVTYWKNLISLYHIVRKSLESRSNFFEKGGILFCHISHVYETGASLYFTMMAKQEKGNEIIQWQKLKQVVSDAITENGGAISHHHGIGKDHQAWYLQQLNPVAAKILKNLKFQLDPENILNPGKLFNA